uniref:Uncharacterized protein n=1 Tax=Heliothis virescens TaxID=7102 RepID=A0A2A4IVT2_HELVI
MKYLFVIFFCVVVELTSSRHVRFPNGLELWIQKVDVFEINEYGQEVPQHNYEDEEPLIDIRSAFPSIPDSVPVWGQKPYYDTGKIKGLGGYAGLSGSHCPKGKRVGSKCIVPVK